MLVMPHNYKFPCLGELCIALTKVVDREMNAERRSATAHHGACKIGSDPPDNLTYGTKLYTCRL